MCYFLITSNLCDPEYFFLSTCDRIIVETEVESFDFFRSFSFSLSYRSVMQEKQNLYTLENSKVLGEELQGISFGWGFHFPFFASSRIICYLAILVIISRLFLIKM